MLPMKEMKVCQHFWNVERVGVFLSPGSCQPILEPQCHMLPYNQTWLSASGSVVKSSEVDMLLR